MGHGGAEEGGQGGGGGSGGESALENEFGFTDSHTKEGPRDRRGGRPPVSNWRVLTFFLFFCL